MIDRSLLKENPELVIVGVHKKEPSFDVKKLIALDNKVREIRLAVEALRHKKNELASQAKGGVTPALREESIQVGTQLKNQEIALHEAEQEFMHLYLSCPNIPLDDVPVGGKEANAVIRVFGEKKTFSFTPKNHVDLATALGWIDFETSSTLASSNFIMYKNEGVALIYALVMLMLDHNRKHGFSLVLPPYLVNEESLIVSGNFPKFKDQVYAVQEDGLYLIPTAEVSLANVYRNTILTAEQLPIRMTSWTSCFRREAGGYGAQERGLIRVHQFEKVELFTLCDRQDSAQEQERMLACAEELLQMLGLHYRVSLLAGQDCSFPSAKTYDIEVWLPGQKAYYEVSSISNCTDFQARRGLIRYRTHQDHKPELVHTLNGSSLALSRLMVALFEVYQQADGSIALPEILKKPVSLWQ